MYVAPRRPTPAPSSPDPAAPAPTALAQPPEDSADAAVPTYLSETYTWAYLSTLGTRVFDHQAVVTAILWGNARRLIAWAAQELQPGWRVLQPAAVYGSFSRDIAARLGPSGHLEVADVAPVQVALTRRKLADIAQAAVVRRDACTLAPSAPFDAVTCFFLLHEVPEDIKTAVVESLLKAVRVGGKVVFVDYHRPAAWHPLRPVMAVVFALLEPFARALWNKEISSYASEECRNAFSWDKETLFGGLYQKVVAVRHS